MKRLGPQTAFLATGTSGMMKNSVAHGPLLRWSEKRSLWDRAEVHRPLFGLLLRG